MDYRIKHVEMTEPNFRALIELDELCFPHDVRIRPRYNDRQWWFACDKRGNAVGYAGISLYGDKTAYLCRIGVAHEHRRKGLARRLLLARLVFARRHGSARIVTYTMPDNPGSINNLIRHGFKAYTPAYCWAGSGAVYWWKDL